MASGSTMIDIHTHQPQPDAKYILAYSVGIDTEPARGVTFSAGIHPWSAASIDIDSALKYLGTAPAVAIGEIGLDYSKDIDKDLQKKVFEAQLEIAQRRGLPVIIHCVKAYNDVLNILHGYNLKVIFHGYTGSPEQTATIVKRGYYISLGKASLKSAKTVESLRIIPLSLIFAETDVSCTGIQTMYKELAAALGVTLQQLIEIIRNNYKTIFE